MKTTKRTIHQTAFADCNFTLVRDKHIGGVLFGCPHEVIKYFNKENEPVPANIVIPQRTFRKGKKLL